VSDKDSRDHLEQEAFDIYQHALELGRDERSAYIQATAGDRKAVMDMVYALLGSAKEAEEKGFMRTPAAEIKQMGSARKKDKTSKPVPLPPPIGNYTPIKLLGEGGFGQVFLAEQTVPVARRVAIKLMRNELCTERFIRRFESEWQMLAVLNHPNIAKIIDAGTGSDGRPYLVMEYIQGNSIINYCNQHQIDIRCRLDLFLQVCSAIQHAHQKGVIHRDIKPENILVSELDGNAVPKVIDFGIAKALDLKVNQKTMLISTDFFGSPSYMSPEQIEQAELDIDTRSDVYGLGVLLYELLTNSTPFVNDDSLMTLMNQILSQEPDRPSTKAQQMSDEQLANIGGIKVTALRKLLEGDLDWIVTKALEKSRDERYSSASAFSADINRYLANEPVIARAPTVVYRSRKFVRRHTLGVMASAIILVLLITGILGTSMGFVNARSEAARARLAETNAQQQADTAQQTVTLLLEFLSAVDPGEKGRDLKVVALLEAFEPRIDQLEQRPVIQSSLLYTYASTYSGLGLLGEALAFAERAFRNRETHLGEFHLATIEAIVLWADLLVKTGQYDIAEQWAREAIARTSNGNTDGLTLLFVANAVVADALQKRGKFLEAEELLRNNLIGRSELLGKDHPDTLQSMTQLATIFWHQNRLGEAERLHREVLKKRTELFGEDHPDTVSTLNGLAVVVSESGQLTEGIKLHRATLEKRTRVLGTEHPDTLASMANLAWVLGQQGQFADAEAQTRQVWEIEKRILGPEHPDTLTTMGNLASALERLDRMPEAEKLHRIVWLERSKILGEEHPSTLTGLNDLAVALARQGKYQQAKTLFQDLIIRRTNAVGKEHPGTLTSMGNLAWVLTKLNDYDVAVKLHRETLAVKQQALGEDHHSTLSTMSNLANALMEQGNLTEAEQLFRESRDKRKNVLGAEHAATIQSTIGLGIVAQRLGNPAEAKLLFEEALDIQLKTLGPEHKNTLRTKQLLEGH